MMLPASGHRRAGIATNDASPQPDAS